LISIQVIPNQVQVASEGLVVLSNNIFWAFGRRFMQYDTFQLEDDDGGAGGNANEGD
jgi:hypothetical protein